MRGVTVGALETHDLDTVLLCGAASTLAHYNAPLEILIRVSIEIAPHHSGGWRSVRSFPATAMLRCFRRVENANRFFTL